MEKQVTGVCFAPDNARYLKLVMTGLGMSRSALLDAIITAYRADHPETYEQAKARIREMQEEMEGTK